MKKTILRWVIVLLALYIIGHILFDFGETRLMRIITGSIGPAFFVCILFYINSRSKDEK
jgi:hypothetical protein